MDFNTAFTLLIGNEGKYVNDPDDLGGETKFGISKRTYPQEDIANLTLDQAKQLYLRDFWMPLTGVPDDIRFQAFDFAVNSGMGTAIRKLQSSIGAADDGHWGPVSQGKFAKMDPAAVTMLYIAERLDFMRKLSTWPKFGDGWAGRIASDLRTAAREL